MSEGERQGERERERIMHEWIMTKSRKASNSSPPILQLGGGDREQAHSHGNKNYI